MSSSEKERTIVITGGTGGIGFQSALALAGENTGTRVIVTGRNQERGEEAKKRIMDESGNKNIEFVKGDISSIQNIDALASALNERAAGRIDVLVNNAGYLGSELKHSDDQIEMHFAVNVLAPWRLTRALLPALKAGDHARVLNITGGDAPAAIDTENLQAEKGFAGLMTYKHSKSALESMSMVLSEQLEKEGVTVNVFFPGRASTAMTQNSLSLGALPGLMKLFYPLFRLLFAEDGGKSAKKAARSTIWGATSPDLEGVTGKYFDTDTKEQKMHQTAYDSEVQASIVAVIEGAETSAASQQK